MAQIQKREKVALVMRQNRDRWLSPNEIITQVNNTPNRLYKIGNNMELSAFLKHLAGVERKIERINNSSVVFYKVS